VQSNLRPKKAAPVADEDGPLARWKPAGREYFQHWLVIGALIGVVAGLGSIVFYGAIALCTHLFVELGAGYTPPAPAGEGVTVIRPITRPWLIPVITTVGGLLCGLIVYAFAPEAEGHGTDAAIEAFHHTGGKIRGRIPPIKLIASAITIGSGGSAGREGPTAQIAAGFGSWLGDVLHLNEHDRRIAMATGVGAGIGSIFKAPFGGALLSGEILYKRDFETEALFPAFIASVVGFSIYCLWAGWTPIFGQGGHFSFTDPESLLGFLLLGVICGLVGLLYPRALYGLRDLFHTIPIPNQLKPALGGLLVGLIGLAFPEALGMSYGYAQFAIDGTFLVLSAWLMLVLVFVKLLTTSLTIGSGGSGGVFGPGMVIGGFVGAALWSGLHSLAPWMLGGTPPGAFAVVGMAAFFGGVGKAPLAVILMVAEMTGEFSLIVPAMLATMVAYLITGETSIYESQLDIRLDSPAHKHCYAVSYSETPGAAVPASAGWTAVPDQSRQQTEVKGSGTRSASAESEENMARNTAPAKPSGLLKWGFNIPILLYRAQLGWLLGHHFLLLTHQGRKTGKTRQTVLEVACFDRDRDESAVMSAYGEQADWYQNILAHPALEVQTGGKRYVPEQRLLDADERLAALAAYEHRYRWAFRAVMRILGYHYDGTPDGLRALADSAVMIGLRPRDRQADLPG
jgi:CIC family chloride channel protein